MDSIIPGKGYTWAHSHTRVSEAQSPNTGLETECLREGPLAWSYVTQQ